MNNQNEDFFANMILAALFVSYQRNNTDSRKPVPGMNDGIIKRRR